MDTKKCKMDDSRSSYTPELHDTNCNYPWKKLIIHVWKFYGNGFDSKKDILICLITVLDYSVIMRNNHTISYHKVYKKEMKSPI